LPFRNQVVCLPPDTGLRVSAFSGALRCHRFAASKIAAARRVLFGLPSKAAACRASAAGTLILAQAREAFNQPSTRAPKEKPADFALGN
jgi:hypothetical protein